MINIYQGIPVSGSTVSASHCYLLFIQLRRQGWNCARFEGEEHETATPRWQSQVAEPGFEPRTLGLHSYHCVLRGVLESFSSLKLKDRNQRSISLYLAIFFLFTKKYMISCLSFLPGNLLLKI